MKSQRFTSHLWGCFNYIRWEGEENMTWKKTRGGGQKPLQHGKVQTQTHARKLILFVVPNANQLPFSYYTLLHSPTPATIPQQAYRSSISISGRPVITVVLKPIWGLRRQKLAPLPGSHSWGNILQSDVKFYAGWIPSHAQPNRTEPTNPAQQL